MPGSHLLPFELSLPVVHNDLPSTAILAATGGFRGGLGISAADSLDRKSRQGRLSRVELARSLRWRSFGAVGGVGSLQRRSEEPRLRVGGTRFARSFHCHFHRRNDVRLRMFLNYSSGCPDGSALRPDHLTSWEPTEDDPGPISLHSRAEEDVQPAQPALDFVATSRTLGDLSPANPNGLD